MAILPPTYPMNFLSLGLSADTIRPKDAGKCHNCFNPVSDSFCGHCGQSRKTHVASAREFLHEFLGHHLAVDAKIWRTLALLCFRPGQLATEFIAGRRSSYIDPLRLLLTVSVVVFALLTVLPESPKVQATPSAAVLTKSMGKPDASKPQRTPPAIGAAVTRIFEKFDPTITGKWNAYLALPDEQGVEVFWPVFMKYAPTCILCMIPFVALYLKVLNLGFGWRYGEHLVFAIHLQAFILLMMLLWFCLNSWLFVANAAMIWLLLYPVLAVRRMYGGGWPVALVRGAALFVLEWISIQVGLQLALLLTLTHSII